MKLNHINEYMQVAAQQRAGRAGRTGQRNRHWHNFTSKLSIMQFLIKTNDNYDMYKITDIINWNKCIALRQNYRNKNNYYDNDNRAVSQ